MTLSQLRRQPAVPVILATVAMLLAPSNGQAGGCPDQTTLQNFTGAGSVVCPCFSPTEQAGVVLNAPAAHYPIEILRVGIAWGSQFGGQPQSLEQAIHVYEDGLPDPGTPVFSLAGPLLTDGFVNEFDLEALPGEVIVSSDSFTVTLEFANQNAGQVFAPTVVHDGNGCQPGRNVVFAVPGGWIDACLAGVTGDWVMYVVYRACAGTVGIDDGPLIASSQPVMLMPARPNPFVGTTALDFFIAEPGHVTVAVYDVAGRRVSTLADGEYSAGSHPVSWNGRSDDGGRLSSGAYFVKLEAGEHRSLRKVLLTD
jgi:hypothetical protein